MKGLCKSCDATVIQGVKCHEHGCPEAHKQERECKWCGAKFHPESRWQITCSPECYEAHWGL